MKKMYLKLTSLLLVTVMTLCVFPLTASATDKTEIEETNEINTVTEQTTAETEAWQRIDNETHQASLGYNNPDIPRPVTEIESRREENVKHFLLPDGTVEAIVYSNAVHRKAADGEWKDIDNTLSANNAKAPNLYVTDDLRVAFAKSFSPNGQLFALNENGYGISMKLITNTISLSPMEPISAAAAAAVSEVTVNNAERRSDKKKWDSVEEAVRVDNASSIRYSNVKANTDLEYVLEGNNVKENIIIKSAGGSYVYTFELGLSGLTPTLREDGSINLSDVETGRSEYIIPAPYMFDADGEYSYDVYYTLTEKSEGVYTLKITADSEWINFEDRAFPVTVDPTFTRDSTKDTYIDSGNPSTSYGSSNQLWISSARIPFIYTPMPTLSDSATITNARLYVAFYYYSNVTSNSLTASAYLVNMSWSNSLTWNTANAYSNLGMSTTQLSSTTFSGSIGAYENTPKWVYFDITSAANSWRSGVTNNGIAIKRLSGTNSAVILKSEDVGSFCPYISIAYTEPRIANGVYKIKNVGTGKYVDVTDRGTASGTQLQQWEGTANDGNTAQLFKITFVTVSSNFNYYTVRPLTNCGLGMNIPSLDGTATVQSLSTEDSWSSMPWNQSIAIMDLGEGYAIKSGNNMSEQFLMAPSSGTNGSKLYSSPDGYLNGMWTFERYTPAIDGATFTSFDYDVIAGETAYYKAVMYSSTIGRNGPVTYSVKNEDGTTTDKATINSTTGVLNALKPGTIRVCASYAGTNSYWYRTLTIEPSFVQDLVDNNLTSYSDIRKTDDGFYMLMTPLADILDSAGIYTVTYTDNGESKELNVAAYYDDWYVYAIKTDHEYTYSLIEMQELENNGNIPHVSVSFVEFDYDTLTTLLSTPTSQNSSTFYQEYYAVTKSNESTHGMVLTEYFSATTSDAPYLIAEEYIKIVVATAQNGVICVSERFKNVINDTDTSSDADFSERLREAIIQNNSDAGYNIYNMSNNTITISNPDQLTMYEKYAILITHVANVNFNSFAAEVEFHADLAGLNVIGLTLGEIQALNRIYNSALRADMAIESKYYREVIAPYYNLNSTMVTQQANEHGEY